MASWNTLGAILAGGASRRFGSPKALAPVDGVPMVERVARAVAAAGIEPVVIGLQVPFARWRPDEQAGLGPLGGILTALHWAEEERLAGVLCVAVDMPYVTGEILGLILRCAQEDWAAGGPGGPGRARDARGVVGAGGANGAGGAGTVRAAGGAGGATGAGDANVAAGSIDAGHGGGVEAADEVRTGGGGTPPGGRVVVPESHGPLGFEPLCGWYPVAVADSIAACLGMGERSPARFLAGLEPVRVPQAVVARAGDPRRLFHNVNRATDVLQR